MLISWLNTIIFILVLDTVLCRISVMWCVMSYMSHIRYFWWLKNSGCFTAHMIRLSLKCMKPENWLLYLHPLSNEDICGVRASVWLGPGLPAAHGDSMHCNLPVYNDNDKKILLSYSIHIMLVTEIKYQNNTFPKYE